MSFVDQSILYWIRQRVSHLGEDVVRIDQAYDAGLLRRPEILPATAQCILALGEELVEMFDERWIVAVGIVDTGVMMVAHRHREQHFDPASGGGNRQAVNEGVVRLVVGPH